MNKDALVVGVLVRICVIDGSNSDTRVVEAPKEVGVEQLRGHDFGAFFPVFIGGLSHVHPRLLARELKVEGELVGVDLFFASKRLHQEWASCVAVFLVDMECIVARQTKDAVDRLGDTSLIADKEVFEISHASV